MIELSQIVAGWPFVASFAMVAALQALRAGRRRSALNEALHELRRPLQAVALAVGPQLAATGGRDSIELAAAALERLDREINGTPPSLAMGVVEARTLVESAVGRWQVRAELAEASLEVRWSAGQAAVWGERCALGQALDNLIVNAIEHGGPTIVVAARLGEGRLRIAVVDSGQARQARSRRGPAAMVARLSGSNRHGHGLSVVRRVAAAHGGRFALRRAARGSLAVLELPLVETGSGQVA